MRRSFLLSIKSGLWRHKQFWFIEKSLCILQQSENRKAETLVACKNFVWDRTYIFDRKVLEQPLTYWIRWRSEAFIRDTIICTCILWLLTSRWSDCLWDLPLACHCYTHTRWVHPQPRGLSSSGSDDAPVLHYLDSVPVCYGTPPEPVPVSLWPNSRLDSGQPSWLWTGKASCCAQIFLNVVKIFLVFRFCSWK